MKKRMLIAVAVLLAFITNVRGGELTTAMTPVFDNYEALRAELAGDSTITLAENATRLKQAAVAAVAKADGETKKDLESLAASATKLLAATDLNGAREAFGEVSRHLLAVVAAAPNLAEGRFVFACPMAKPYGKWVQSEKKLANPYMGGKMLACGMPSKWSE
ncbi:MAG TPA: hypothetical protein VM534_08275 [Thermoanaerobaculia bacterium]|nr:hypothetical protein [Thermoanaerobaculia bacterium]